MREKETVRERYAFREGGERDDFKRERVWEIDLKEEERERGKVYKGGGKAVGLVAVEEKSGRKEK